MPARSIVIAPHPALKQVAKAAPANDETRRLMQDLGDTVLAEEAMGLSAPMVGESLCVIAFRLEDGGIMAMANPKIVQASDEMVSMSEASLSYPGISADVSRHAHIKVSFMREDGSEATEAFSGITARVIMHEMDYLFGRSFLDLLGPVKKDSLLRKMEKFKRQNSHGHVHSAFCNH